MKRLQQQEEFSLALKSQAKIEGWVAAHSIFNHLGFARLGIVVGKRVMSRAVDRNRAKRLIREVFRHEAQNLGSLDIVIRVKMNPFIKNTEIPVFSIVRLFESIKKCK